MLANITMGFNKELMISLSDGIEGSEERQVDYKNEISKREKGWKWIAAIILLHLLALFSLVLYKSIIAGYTQPIINGVAMLIFVIWNFVKLSLGKLPVASFKWYIIDIACIYTSVMLLFWSALAE